eukprot:TRINITY_DN2841_c0_g1_i3.p2 TRINITY_DN2841_c0_g1~~TRINITY_DN2841_c0_g1_i3.p2  ORF type:complete len:149 (-),score=32.64 TRINITY_DN2841_c0_g1_i3:1-447(-)
MCIRDSYLGVRDVGGEKEISSIMICEKIDDQLEEVTAMTISSNRQCLAIACNYRGDGSAYIFFYDTSMATNSILRMRKLIHEGDSSKKEKMFFTSIAFSPDAKQIATLSDSEDSTLDKCARIYEWKKEQRLIASNAWKTELKLSLIHI